MDDEKPHLAVLVDDVHILRTPSRKNVLYSWGGGKTGGGFRASPCVQDLEEGPVETLSRTFSRKNILQPWLSLKHGLHSTPSKVDVFTGFEDDTPTTTIRIEDCAENEQSSGCKISVRIVLVVFVLLTTGLAAGSTWLVSDQFGRANAIKLGGNLLETVTVFVNTSLENVVHPVQSQAQLARAAAFDSDHSEEFDFSHQWPYLSGDWIVQLSEHPAVIGVFMAMADGDYLSVTRMDLSGANSLYQVRRAFANGTSLLYETDSRGHPAVSPTSIEEGFDGRQAQWYQDSVKSSTTRLEWMLRMRLLEVPSAGEVVGCTVPMTFGGKLRGVVAAALAPHALTTFLIESRNRFFTSDSLLYLIDSQYRLIAMSNPNENMSRTETGLSRTVYTCPDPRVGQTAMVLRFPTGAPTVTTQMANLAGQGYFTSTSPFRQEPTLSWALYIIVPDSFIIGEFNESTRINAIINACILITSVILVSILAWWITQPLNSLRAGMAAMLSFMTADKASLRKEGKTRRIERRWIMNLLNGNSEAGVGARRESAISAETSSSSGASGDSELSNYPTQELVYKRRVTGLAEVDGIDAVFTKLSAGVLSFMKYVPREVVRTVVREARAAELGMEPREITVMFSDLRGFTSLTERVSHDQLVFFLTEYFRAVTTALERHSATIDKFIGDAVMAVWNAPSPVNGHEVKACRGALATLRELARIEPVLAEQGLPPLRARIGVVTGECLVGNVGSPSRMNYTALGDYVNLASRLESLNKLYGTNILVGESTHDEACHIFEFRLIDRVRVRGKTVPTLVYELLGEKPAPGSTAPPVKTDKHILYERALVHMWDQKFEEAQHVLAALATWDDVATARLKERVELYTEYPHQFSEALILS